MVRMREKSTKTEQDLARTKLELDETREKLDSILLKYESTKNENSTLKKALADSAEGDGETVPLQKYINAKKDLHKAKKTVALLTAELECAHHVLSRMEMRLNQLLKISYNSLLRQIDTVNSEMGILLPTCPLILAPDEFDIELIKSVYGIVAK